jgi:hypothetical protein
MLRAQQNPDSVYPGAGTLCPRCGGVAYRMPRRWIDRLTSHFRPVWRYSCQRLGCRLEFNLHPGR